MGVKGKVIDIWNIYIYIIKTYIIIYGKIGKTDKDLVIETTNLIQ